MAAYIIFDVEIWDPVPYQEFMIKVKPAIEAAGGKYLARGGAHEVLEGDWQPSRIVLFEFPSVEQAKAFYYGDVYQGCKEIRDTCSKGNVVVVEGLPG